MAFVGEYVDEADYQAFCTHPVHRWGKPLVPTQWAVDREARAFLASYWFDRERLEFEDYVFWWRGDYVIFEVELTEPAPHRDGERMQRVYRFTSPIQLPEGMCERSEEFRALIEEAFRAYAAFPLRLPVTLAFVGWSIA